VIWAFPWSVWASCIRKAICTRRSRLTAGGSRGYTGQNGWAFDGAASHNSDADDSKELYTILEEKIVPLYYSRDDSGIPQQCVKVMIESIKSTVPNFSSRRMVKDYALKFYQQALRYSNGLKL
jgi:glucan phosphorylase